MNNIKKLVSDLKKFNEEYRKGTPLITDKEYDSLIEKLKKAVPQNPFLNTVEPEIFETKKEVKHPAPMLSIEKAYTKDQLKKFIARVKKEAEEIGIKNPEFTVMPKLDGLAGRDDGKILATRGSGTVGYDITELFKKGLEPIGGRGYGLGELVIVNSYFKKHLAKHFEHPRNMVAGIAAADNLNEFAKKALAEKKILFIPYTFLDKWTGTGEDLLGNLEKIFEDLAQKTDYPMDGMVVYIENKEIKKYMGSTANAYRWQIAVKTKGETGVTTVKDIIWQVGRTGNITPVLLVEPLSLSGATIRRITAHHAGMVQNKKIGKDAVIEVIRSGEVIPKLEKIIKKSLKFNVPAKCPSCGSKTAWNNDFLKCENYNCKAQIEQRINHWFKTLGNANWFGIKTIQKLTEAGYDDIKKMYLLQETDFVNIGFGPIQSKNLMLSLITSQKKEIEDWRFLAAFGIVNLGIGESVKLLSYISLEKISMATAEFIENIEGFGPITSLSIAEGIKKTSNDLNYMLSLGFNLTKTPKASEIKSKTSPIAGKRILFTGKIESGTRENMQINARKLGATVQTSIAKNTDYLIYGTNAGASKLNKAKKLKIYTLSEKEYIDLIITPETKRY
ncbi:MAG: DNA ligase [Deltaproteobacteria bacterium]|nr:DNA ligase [Deltaproteobacteria bacterium]